MVSLRALLAALRDRSASGSGVVGRQSDPVENAAEPDEIRPGLCVGDETAARACGHRFDRVVSVAEGLQVESTTDSFDLSVDESVLERTEEFADAVEAVRTARRTDGQVLVHCHEGRERAPTVAAAALAADSGADFETALAAIREARPIVEPTPPLVAVGKRYLDGCSGESGD